MPREVPKTRETTAPPTLTAASYIIDDALKAMEHKDDPQTKVPTSVILTLAILAVGLQAVGLPIGGPEGSQEALTPPEPDLIGHVPLAWQGIQKH